MVANKRYYLILNALEILLRDIVEIERTETYIIRMI